MKTTLLILINAIALSTFAQNRMYFQDGFISSVHIENESTEVYEYDVKNTDTILVEIVDYNTRQELITYIEHNYFASDHNIRARKLLNKHFVSLENDLLHLAELNGKNEVSVVQVSTVTGDRYYLDVIINNQHKYMSLQEYMLYISN